MAKGTNQKLKLMYLNKLLHERADEAHPMSVPQMIEALAAYGVPAERKSIYDDLETLRTFGVDVCSVRGRTTGYFIGSREFELAELKLLTDSVQSSRFITEKKTVALIKKLSALASVHEASALRREVYVAGRVKSMNESIYYNIDRIHTAIADNKRITFKYFEYGADGKKRWRREGKRYDVSPFALTWDSENYYLIAYDSQAGSIRHYRVDKLDKIDVSAEPREGVDVYGQLDMAVYSRRRFSMMGGSEQSVTMRFAGHLAGVVIDRFGKDVAFSRSDEGYFTVCVPVVVSPQFFGWLFGLDGEAQIISPKEVADEMRSQLKRVQKGMKK